MSEVQIWTDFVYNVDDHLSWDFPAELVDRLYVIPDDTELRILFSYDPGSGPVFNRVYGDIPPDPAELEVLQIMMKRPSDTEYRNITQVPEYMFALEWFITTYAYDKMEEAAQSFLGGYDG